jgi:hypothetical protein
MGGSCWLNGGVVHPFDYKYLATHHRKRLHEEVATSRLARRKTSSWFRRSVSGLRRLLTRRQPVSPATIRQSLQPPPRHVEDAVATD